MVLRACLPVVDEQYTVEKLSLRRRRREGEREGGRRIIASYRGRKIALDGSALKIQASIGAKHTSKKEPFGANPARIAYRSAEN